MTSTARQTLLLWPGEQSYTDYDADGIDEYFVELNDNERVSTAPATRPMFISANSSAHLGELFGASRRILRSCAV